MAEPKRVWLSWSSGKDCAYALQVMRQDPTLQARVWGGLVEGGRGRRAAQRKLRSAVRASSRPLWSLTPTHNPPLHPQQRTARWWGWWLRSMRMQTASPCTRCAPGCCRSRRMRRGCPSTRWVCVCGARVCCCWCWCCGHVAPPQQQQRQH